MHPLDEGLNALRMSYSGPCVSTTQMMRINLLASARTAFVLASSRDEISYPSTLRMEVFVSPSDHAASTMDQQYFKD